MDDEDDFIIDELIAATDFVEREHGLSFNSGNTQTTDISSNLQPNRTEVNIDESSLVGDDIIDEFEEDDNILNVSVECSSNKFSQMPMLHCSGDDSSNSTFHAKSFVRSGCFMQQTHDIDARCPVDSLFGLKISENTIATDEEIKVLFNKARMNIQTLYVASRENSNLTSNKSYMQLRVDVTSLLFIVWRLVKRDRVNVEIVRTIFRSLHMLLGSVDSLPIFNIIHTANCIAGNESLSPAYHLMHGNLEWRVLRLSSLIAISRIQPNFCQISVELRTIIYDLILLSVSKFNRMKRVDLFYRSPFPCTCVKELWLLVQLQIEAINGYEDGNAAAAGATDGDHTFWSYFNDALQFVQSNSDNTEQSKSSIDDKLAYRKFSKHLPSNWTDFSTWLLCGVAKLQGYSMRGQLVGPNNSRVKENYLLMDQLLRDYIATDPVEDSLRITLFVILPIITEWWPPKTDILLVLWEFFNKKLNSSFYIQGSAPLLLAVVNTTVIGYLDNIFKKINATSVNPNETSFMIFTHMFGRVLKRLTTTDKSQINRIFGRITSKFSAPKLLALNETGIYNLNSLFLTLAMTTPLKDTAQRLQTILLQMTLAKLSTARQAALVRGHVALIVLFIRNEINAGQYITKLLEQIGAIYQDEGYSATSKILADGLIAIFTQSESFVLGQDLLIGPWLIKHLSVAASVVESQNICTCISATLTKIISTRFTMQSDELTHANEVLRLIYLHFVPFCLQTFSKPDACKEVAELAANLCLNVNQLSDSSSSSSSSINNKNNASKFNALFKQFADINGVNTQNLAAFLVLISSSNSVHLTDETLIINKWIQCCMFVTNASEDFKNLTNYVVSTNEFRSVFVADASEILNEREPLCKFFSQIGILYNATNEYQKRIQIGDKLHRYLASFDQYIAVLLETPENSMKVFSMIAIIIYHCAHILYVKGKNSCFFNLIMFQFILPNHVLTGRPQSQSYVLAIHKVWHMLILGIEKLDFQTDQHLVTITTNLIEKWLPHFRTIPSKMSVSRPFLNCIKECQSPMNTFVFTKITNGFLALQRRQPHALADLVLSIYSDIVNDRLKSCESWQIETLLNCSCIVLIEHAMMIDEVTSTKQSIFDFFENLAKNGSDSIRTIILSNLKQATDKHLAYFSAYYFRFVTRFAQIQPSLINALLDHLKNAIAKVEVMRGAGRDGKLRSELSNLEQALILASFQ